METPTFWVRVQSTVPVPWTRRGTERDKRILRGFKAFSDYAEAHFHNPDDRLDRETVLSDLISDLLTYGLKVNVDPAVLLERAGTSFQGDFEDDEEQLNPVEQIEAWLHRVEQQYQDEVVPGSSDNSVLEAERDTLEQVLSILKGAS